MTPRVLIVDDHDGTRRMIARTLRRAGWTVAAEAVDGAGALAAVAQDDTLDVIVLDVHLPDLDGPEIARRIVESRHAARIVLVSTQHARDGQELSRCAGADGFIPKDEFTAARLAALTTEAS